MKIYRFIGGPLNGQHIRVHKSIYKNERGETCKGDGAAIHGRWKDGVIGLYIRTPRYTYVWRSHT